VGRGSRSDWGIVGAALTVLTCALVAAKVTLPYGANVAIAVGAGVAILVGLGWWQRLLAGAGTQVRRVVRRQLEAAKREAILRSCERVVALLVALVGAPEEFEERRRFDVSRLVRERHILARYRKTVRALCLDTLAALPPALTPPTRLEAIAAEPKSVRELQSLLAWFVATADRLRSPPDGPTELSPADRSGSAM
jgi:hypothetical protein